MLPTAELEYDLPPDRIATVPAEPRDSARLMVVRRGSGEILEHTTVRELPRLLRAGDLMVMNATKVLPARFIGRRADTGGGAEGLYLGMDPLGGGSTDRWIVLVKGKKLRPGIEIELSDDHGQPSGTRLRLIERAPEEGGAWRVEVVGEGLGGGPEVVLERLGRTPLPPYILKAREKGEVKVDDRYDRERYQTTYAQAAGSVAAPTAGLHLTPELLASLVAAGVSHETVTLHVGAGTFKNVETEFVEQHQMHTERCLMPRAAAAAIARTRGGGGSRVGRVICIGTTAARTVETYGMAADGDLVGHERVHPGDWTDTRILITPGHRWRWMDGLLTNFHLPRSTLLAMCGALFDGGVGTLKSIYAEAIRERYRFFSYGDAMLILP